MVIMADRQYVRFISFLVDLRKDLKNSKDTAKKKKSAKKKMRVIEVVLGGSVLSGDGGGGGCGGGSSAFLIKMKIGRNEDPLTT